MAAPGTIHGARGQVKFAYLTAAVVTDYLITRDPETRALTLTGTVADAHAYLLAQSPLTFVQVVKGGAWRWPIEAWRVAGDRCVARLGALIQ